MTKMKQLPPISVTNATAIATVYTPPGTHEGEVGHRVVEKSSSQFLSTEAFYERLGRLQKLIMEGSERMRIHEQVRMNLFKTHEIETKKLILELSEALRRQEETTLKPSVILPPEKEVDIRISMLPASCSDFTIEEFKQELAVLLGWEKGNRTAVAKRLECSKRIVDWWIKDSEWGAGSPLFRYKRLKGRGGPTVAISEGKLLRALKRHNGDAEATAREIGYADGSAVRNRVRRAKVKSKLKRWWNSPRRL